MKWLYDKLENTDSKAVSIWSEKDYTPIIETLQKNTGKNAVVLLKGSRGMALENVLDSDYKGGQDE